MNRSSHEASAEYHALVVFILALSVGNHLMAFLAAPALFMFLWLVVDRSYVAC